MQNQSLNFVMQSTSSYPATCSAGFNQNMVYRGGIDGNGRQAPPGEFNKWAKTVYCFSLSTGLIHNYYMKFDIDEDWWLGGEGTTVPSDRLDWFSVAAHEFGHAAGWEVHFSHYTLCPDPPNVVLSQTMCRYMPYGTSYARTISTHDIHTFEAWY
jgi:hypothetical protein